MGLAMPPITNYPWGLCENFNRDHLNEKRPATQIVVSTTWNITPEPQNCIVTACDQCTTRLLRSSTYQTLNIMYNMLTTPKNTKKG